MSDAIATILRTVARDGDPHLPAAKQAIERLLLEARVDEVKKMPMEFKLYKQERTAELEHQQLTNKEES